MNLYLVALVHTECHFILKCSELNPVYIIVSPFHISSCTVILLQWLLLNCSEQQKEKPVWLHVCASLLQVNKTVQLIQ